MNRGIAYAIGAFAMWGLFPIYWKQLPVTPPVQLVSHRVVWSFLLLMLIIIATRSLKTFIDTALKPKVIFTYTVAALLVGSNWILFVWAVQAGYIVETSLGYFINPLLSVMLGILFFREKLRTWQTVSLLLAACGLIYLTSALGSVPWVALALALTFATYGMAKKIAPLNALHGLALETMILVVPATGYLIYLHNDPSALFLHKSWQLDLLLIGSGIVTTMPLLLFASAAQRIPLRLLGVLQYLSPTLQFLLGVFLYKEPFSAVRLIGFSIVWVALIAFAIEGFLFQKQNRQSN